MIRRDRRTIVRSSSSDIWSDSAASSDERTSRFTKLPSRSRPECHTPAELLPWFVGLHSQRASAIKRSAPPTATRDRKSTRLNSSHGYISYAVFCLKKKKTTRRHREQRQSPIQITSYLS